VLDMFTINVVVAVVTVAAAVMFLLETILRREVGPGRVWALGFLSGVLTVACYLVWQGTDDPWIAIAIGNAALATTVGFFWLGCRSFNERSLRGPALIVAGVAVLLLMAALAEGVDGGDWAGAELLFIAIGVFALLGAVESRRGTMGLTWSSLGLTLVLLFVAAYYTARAVTLYAGGPEGSVFQTWFNSANTGLVSVVLTIVALTTATMLRGGHVVMRRGALPTTREVAPDGLLSARSFETALEGMLERARHTREPIAVVALRVDDLPQIGMAFGADEEASIAAQHREGARRYAPTVSVVAEGSSGGVVFAFGPASEADARLTASRVQRRLLDDFATRGSAVIPVVGVGVALSRDAGSDARTMVIAAEDAARRSSTSVEASVILAEGDGGRDASDLTA